MATSARTRREFAPPQKTAPVNPRVVNALVEALKARPDVLEGLRESVAEAQLREGKESA